MRHGASRAFAYAVLASILLHALILFALPAAREWSALVPPEAEPLIARVKRLEPAPAPAPIPEIREPAPPRSAPIATPAPRPVPIVQAPAPAPAPAAPALAPAPAPLARAAPEAAAVPRAPPAVDPAIRSDYARRINEMAERYKVYPRVAIDNDWRGEVALVMAIGSDGRIASLRISRSSGHKVLDEQALKMFARAKPQVRVPAALRGREFELELRAVFRLDS